MYLADFMNIDRELIAIPKNEVLRYLGYRSQGLSYDMEKLIEETIGEAKELIRPRYTYKYFSFTSNKEIIVDKNENTRLFKDMDISIIGKDIINHLSFSKGFYLMAVTLGMEIDKTIRYYEKSNLTKALILDACGTAAVESIADFVCTKLTEELKKDNCTVTSRYSPGYGDFPIDIQREFLRTVEGERTIGLTATKDNILIPRKSVTAVVGVTEEKLDEKKHKKCTYCPNYSTCAYRKESDICGS